MREKDFERYTIVKDNQLKAVHDDDLITLLSSLGVYDDVCDEKIECLFCGEKISINNIGAIIPFYGEIKFSCNSPICLNKIGEVNIDEHN